MDAPLYLDDVKPGDTFVTGSLTVTADDIKAFARRFDPQPFHLDEDAAADSLFGGLAASGWHTAALTMRLLVEGFPLAKGVIGAGGELAWPRPTRPGDVLTVYGEVLEVTPSRTRPDRGMLLVAARPEIRTATPSRYSPSASSPGGGPARDTSETVATAPRSRLGRKEHIGNGNKPCT